MGGLVAFRVANRIELSGLVLSAPLLEVSVANRIELSGLGQSKVCFAQI